MDVIIFAVIYEQERILLAKSLKSFSICFLNAVSFVIGVGTNFNPRERRLTWSSVISEFVKFFMYFLLDSIFLAVISLCVFFHLSLCFVFLNLRFSIFSPLCSLVSHRKQTGIILNSFILPIFQVFASVH